MRGARKLEEAVWRAVNEHAKLGRRVTVVPGHDSDEPKLPYLVISCIDTQPHEDLPEALGLRTGTVVFHLKTDANPDRRSRGNAKAEAERIMDKIESYVCKPVTPANPVSQANPLCGALLAMLNEPAISDTRPVKNLHIYSIRPTEERSIWDSEDAWHDQWEVEFVFQPFDAKA